MQTRLRVRHNGLVMYCWNVFSPSSFSCLPRDALQPFALNIVHITGRKPDNVGQMARVGKQGCVCILMGDL